MTMQVQIILLFVVAGTLVTGAPGIYRVGISHGASARTAGTGGASGKGTVEDGVAHGSLTGKLGASGSGAVDGSVFVQHNDRITEAAAEYAGSAGGWIKPGVKGSLGKNTQTGVYDIGSKGNWRSNGENSGAGSAGIYTDQDALIKFNEHHNRNADDILQEIDDDF